MQIKFGEDGIIELLNVRDNVALFRVLHDDIRWMSSTGEVTNVFSTDDDFFYLEDAQGDVTMYFELKYLTEIRNRKGLLRTVRQRLSKAIEKSRKKCDTWFDQYIYEENERQRCIRTGF